MSTLRIVDHIPDQAVICRKCDRAMVGGTLPARLSLCGGCASNDARAKTTRHMKRTAWQRKRDRLLDRWVPLILQVTGASLIAASTGYWLARALGWVR